MTPRGVAKSRCNLLGREKLQGSEPGSFKIDFYSPFFLCNFPDAEGMRMEIIDEAISYRKKI